MEYPVVEKPARRYPTHSSRRASVPMPVRLRQFMDFAESIRDVHHRQREWERLLDIEKYVLSSGATLSIVQHAGAGIR